MNGAVPCCNGKTLLNTGGGTKFIKGGDILLTATGGVMFILLTATGGVPFIAIIGIGARAGVTVGGKLRC